jgi:general secretion pathway protein H
VSARAARGFTLIELLVVLLIIGSLLTLVPGAFQRVMPGLEIKAAARDVATAFREARSLAIRDNREAVVLFDTEARSYRQGKAGRPLALDPDLGIELVAAQSEQVDEHIVGIRFFPDGTSTGGRVTISRDERRYQIDVDWLSGRVEIIR